MVMGVNRQDQNAFLHMKEFDDTEGGDEARRGSKKRKERRKEEGHEGREGEANKQTRHIR